MGKNFRSDADLDQLLDEQFLREAQLLEQAILSNNEDENNQETDEEVRNSYHKLIQRLKAEGIYREEEDPDEDCSDKNDSDQTDSGEPDSDKKAG